MKHSIYMLALSSIVTLSACSGNDTVTTLPGGPPITTGVPAELQNANNIIQANLRPEVRLSNNDTLTMVQDPSANDTWSGEIFVTPGATYTVTVTWIEKFAGVDLPLATRTFDMQVAQDGTATKSRETDYVFDSGNLDADNDGFSNFSERNDGTDPNAVNSDTPQLDPGNEPEPGPDTDPVTGPGTEPPVTEPDPEPEPEPEPQTPEPAVNGSDLISRDRAVYSYSQMDGIATMAEATIALSLRMPELLFEGNYAGVFDAATIRPDVRLSNGDIVPMNALDAERARWTADVTLPTDVIYKVIITWIETYQGRDLPLTISTFDLVVGRDGSVRESASTGYAFGPTVAGISLDADGDDQVNARERLNGTDPFPSTDGIFVPQTPVQDTGLTEPGAQSEPETQPETQPEPQPEEPESAVLTDSQDSRSGEDNGATPVIPSESQTPLPAIADVIVPRINTSDAPVIDGNNVTLDTSGRFSGEWAQAVQTDISGAILSIDNLMIDNNAETVGSVPFRRWAAVHDGRYLYIVVTVDDNGWRFRDSGIDLHHDDSLELFLDTDNSKAQSYDENDFQITFPLRKAGSNPNSKMGTTEGQVIGARSSQAPLDINFATGPGRGPVGLRRVNFEQDVYELRLDLTSANINSDAAFGFELQVNDDDDSAGRDSKWGWKHPARSNVNVDNTWFNPSYMGTLVLE